MKLMNKPEEIRGLHESSEASVEGLRKVVRGVHRRRRAKEGRLSNGLQGEKGQRGLQLPNVASQAHPAVPITLVAGEASMNRLVSEGEAAQE